MKVVDVIPLSKGVFKEKLTYFTAKEAVPGSIVSIPVRTKKIKGVVIESRDAKEDKAELRSSSYAIKKIENLEEQELFRMEFIDAARDTATFFATTTGEIIQALTPKQILTDAEEFSVPLQKTEGVKKAKEKFIFQSDEQDRLSTYKSIIREEFAKQSSVFFCLPTIQDIEKVFDSLEKGIREYTFILHSGLSKKEISDSWKRIVTEPHPVLIVATASFFSVPRHDIGTLIIDKENSQGYKTFTRPYFDIRKFAEIFSEKAGMKLILGDLLLRTETIWRYEEKEFVDLMPPKFRSLSTAEQKVIDMKKYKRSSEKTFRIISDELIELVKKTKRDNAHLLLFVGRRGMHPITVCSDCGTIVLCNECGAPVVIHKKTKDENIFVCHKCSAQRDADHTCRSCKSWRLTTLGIGIEKVSEELKHLFPDTKILTMSSDTIKTHKKGVEMRDEFFSSPGSMLLGTEMSLFYINKEVEHTAVVSIDSLFAIPDFRINEKIFNLLLTLRTKTQKEFLIQTRNKDEVVFEHVLKGNLLDFYREEIAARKHFQYPPFSTFIKISTEGGKSAVQKEIHRVSELLAGYTTSVFPSPLHDQEKKYKEHIIIKLPHNDWIDEKLLGILQSLPPAFKIQVDPESLL